MTRPHRRRPLSILLGIVLSLAACGDSSTGTDGPPDGTILRGVAVVSPGAGCVTLELKGQRYEPDGLPPELAQVGLRLRVTGIVRRRPSICMSGTGLLLTKAERE